MTWPYFMYIFYNSQLFHLQNVNMYHHYCVMIFVNSLHFCICNKLLLNKKYYIFSWVPLQSQELLFHVWRSLSYLEILFGLGHAHLEMEGDAGLPLEILCLTVGLKCSWNTHRFRSCRKITESGKFNTVCVNIEFVSCSNILDTG